MIDKLETTTMKFLTLFIIAISTCVGQINYFVLPTDSAIELTYKMKGDSFVDNFALPKKINGRTYVQRIRKYSFNLSDTAYFRQDDKNFYASTNPKKNIEYIEIPKTIALGKVWYNNDSTWTFVIKEVDATLVTPISKYEHLIAIEARQPTQKNNQFLNYLNYYAREIGYVGSIVNGQLLNYLTNIKRK